MPSYNMLPFTDKHFKKMQTLYLIIWLIQRQGICLFSYPFFADSAPYTPPEKDTAYSAKRIQYHILPHAGASALKKLVDFIGRRIHSADDSRQQSIPTNLITHQHKYAQNAENRILRKVRTFSNHHLYGIKELPIAVPGSWNAFDLGNGIGNGNRQFTACLHGFFPTLG